MSQSNGNMGAFPESPPAECPYGGLSRRELFAAMAMQGFAADPNTGEMRLENVAAAAVRWADALLAALEEKPDA